MVEGGTGDQHHPQCPGLLAVAQARIADGPDDPRGDVGHGAPKTEEHLVPLERQALASCRVPLVLSESQFPHLLTRSLAGKEESFHPKC